MYVHLTQTVRRLQQNTNKIMELSKILRRKLNYLENKGKCAKIKHTRDFTIHYLDKGSNGLVYQNNLT